MIDNLLYIDLLILFQRFYLILIWFNSFRQECLQGNLKFQSVEINLQHIQFFQVNIPQSNLRKIRRGNNGCRVWNYAQGVNRLYYLFKIPTLYTKIISLFFPREFICRIVRFHLKYCRKYCFIHALVIFYLRFWSLFKNLLMNIYIILTIIFPWFSS